MAASNLNLGKASGGVLNVQPADGTTTTSIVLPASGTVTTNEYVNSNNLGNGSTTFNGFGGSGFKNYIINGNFDVWQRGTNFTGLTNGTYSSDRWVVYDAADDIKYNVTRNAGVFTGAYGATYTWNSGTALRSVIQFIENVTRFKVGSKVTISFEAFTNSTPYTVAVAIQGVKGVWKSATAEATSNITLTNTKTKYSVTLSIPDWTSLGIDWAHLEDTKLALKFNLGVETNGRDFILGRVQLEEGSMATPFEQIPYGLELSLCQRYYQGKVGVLLPKPVNQTGINDATGDKNYYFFKQTMRVAPTVTISEYFSGYDTGSIIQISTGATVGTAASSTLSPDGFTIRLLSGTLSDNGYFKYEASAEL